MTIKIMYTVARAGAKRRRKTPVLVFAPPPFGIKPSGNIASPISAPIAMKINTEAIGYAAVFITSDKLTYSSTLILNGDQYPQRYNMATEKK
ncbi:hypothetical protein D3C85_1516160 [compost metagenome]